MPTLKVEVAIKVLVRLTLQLIKLAIIITRPFCGLPTWRARRRMVAPANNSVNVVADALSLYDFGGRKASEEEEMEEEEEAPTHINTKRSLQFLVVSVDKLSAKYTGEGQHANDVGAFQGNRPAPVRRILYYFEIYIKDRGNKGTISIGFTDEHFKTSRQPGWDQNTYGYHGDDGYLYHAHGRGDAFGPTFHTGDTVGAGINYASQEVFFTVNGKLVGSRHKDEKCPLYPSVGLHSPNERVDINFGQNPFVFNIEALVQEEREKLQREIETLHLPLSISHSVARSYLLHYGYQETLQAFDAASGSMVPPVILTTQENGDKMLEEECYALEHRRKLRQLIRNGDINGTLASLESWYPRLLKSDSNFSAAPMASGEDQSYPSTSGDAGGDLNEDYGNEYGPPLPTQEELREMEHRRLVGEATNMMLNFAKDPNLAKYMTETAFQDVHAQWKATITSSETR
ncbi:hypothetical protein L7F22_030343 [Adiantum nelumboides]|nr:hypothetical protein [Adiantum nelumboides]